ncbi:MAG: OmpA family protein [Deltaproteobacteria bacterium]|jgi:OOP family OmpA-OmpF porin|nr:OmpA family protein [Deltaproteobacteria bacterium]
MKSKILILAAFALVLSFPSLAAAQIEPESLHLSIMGGAIFPDHSVRMDNGALVGLGLGYNFTKNWGIEGFGHYAFNLDDKVDSPDEIANDNDIFMGRFNGIYHFLTDYNFVPYFTLGVGAMKIEGNDREDYSSASANAGLGFKYFFNEVVALRMEANEVVAFKKVDGKRFSAPSITAGLTFQFAQPTACPDSDGDGVCDALDKCPGTPAGYKVDADGCPIAVSITLDVKFDFDKSVVKPQYRSEVQKVADFLNRHPGSTAIIEGHTDSRGSDAYNLKLSDRRAAAVRDYLVNEFNVDPSKLSSVGYGETRPIATNDTEAGRAENRRVVGVFTGSDVDQ